MEKGEPTFVPEWLRSTGNVLGSGSSAQHYSSASNHSDVSSPTHPTRNRNSKTISEFNSTRSAFVDRTSPSNSKRSSSNGPAKHAYSNFSRNHRDKDRDRDKERSSFADSWDRGGSEPLGSLGSILTSRNEKDTLRRTVSMVPRKQSDVLPRRVGVDLKNGSGNHASGNGLISGTMRSGSISKVVFEKDFPSLGSEEKQGLPEIGRVSSPGLSTAVQSLPVTSSALINGEGWTSALAEAPTLIGNNSTISLPVQQTAALSASVSTATFGAPTAVTGLNMAEALTQAPSKTRAAPQLSVQTQRREEWAIKQSRQLIPVTPSMTKSSVLISDKSKPKIVNKATDMNMATKNLQQQPTLLHTGHQSLLGAISSLMHENISWKTFVLKPGWENGVTASPKDVASPTNNNTRPANGQLPTPAVATAPPKSPKNPKHTSGDRKAGNLSLISALNVEKRPLQGQSRSDFFNHLKKKTSMNTSTVIPETVSPSSKEKSYDVDKAGIDAPPSPQYIQNGAQLNSNSSDFEEIQKLPEADVAFLRSLGWEETSGEDEGLTEEEIRSFFQQHLSSAKLKLCDGVLQKLLECYAKISSGGVSSELSSGDSGSAI
ncbi:hypothetical protein K2173_023087 [Erythroxylum novogranatense]|uniref:Mediator of RNA polymerase II transcription subunit 1 n=1 Tax=Erythroxylum novogranatense TaxID=1862640 RepID=A0AAV8T8M9_9ROSI|nr:hypothetical protein K2173_023087 [Erythroxylum novogranatense]